MPKNWRNYYSYPDDDYYDYWWGSPYGWSDLDLYDYNNNFILDDNEIKDIVWDNINADYGITMSDQNKLQIEVNNGVVTLSGEVRNPRTKPLAYADAYWSSGVIDVINNIKVSPHKRRQRGQQQEQDQSQQQNQP
jgi:hypothetical protein